MSVEKSIEQLVAEMQKLHEIANKVEDKLLSKRVVSEETRQKIREKQLEHHEKVRQSKEIERQKTEAERVKSEAEKAKLEAEKAKLEAEKAKLQANIVPYQQKQEEKIEDHRETVSLSKP
jgi:hypothetical protein